jgi:hypothetical protein
VWPLAGASDSRALSDAWPPVCVWLGVSKLCGSCTCELVMLCGCFCLPVTCGLNQACVAGVWSLLSRAVFLRAVITYQCVACDIMFVAEGNSCAIQY